MNTNIQCDCHSYNGDFGNTKEVVLNMLTGITPSDEREYKKVAIDACISPVILNLWNNGISTLGSCCGHGSKPPSIVLGEGVDEYSKIRELIKEKDSRWFELSQWRRVIV